MSAIPLRRPAVRAWIVIGAALAASSAAAADQPATPKGADQLQALFDRFFPAPPAGGPAFVTVKPGGGDYIVSADLGTMNGLLKAVGVGAFYEPATLLYKLFEQDDGNWRLVQDSMPRIVSHAGDATSTIDIQNYKQTVVIDPTLAWWKSGSGSAGPGRPDPARAQRRRELRFRPAQRELRDDRQPGPDGVDRDQGGDRRHRLQGLRTGQGRRRGQRQRPNSTRSRSILGPTA